MTDMPRTASPLDGGVMAAVLTPLDRFLTPDPAMWLDHCRRLLVFYRAGHLVFWCC